ncbi:MAG: hypothetical protein UW35_C0005G0019 [Candidatus Collierbacteria bacterium GW2011_GWF2_44_15]|uniref:DUF2130 domain-containing protein n=2 Tax=Candidatus Collieribacteriota TaxID=1752725 RepID=A0A0G1JSR7_9BACT|nr:MAG: hypothetical protein UW23_C0014G0004 [Candidatus Collierbacteria bacterium GW2011_GWA1_44_12]KKT46942.1 MAG: hypothetical protein UW35_C0005G0019 [Candidatus Collierbacteria bacterium GW2011_GWF2_44_15]
MKKQVKVAIQDENTLQLLEDAQRGDLIDLKSLHESDIDKTSLENLIKAIRNEEFDAQIEAAKKSIGKEKALEAELKEKDIISRAKEALLKKDQEIASLSIKVDNIAKQVESDAKLKALQEKKALEDEYQKTLTQKEAEIQEVKHEKELEKQKFQDELEASKTAFISLKEMRSRMSTKMIGESLEIHCENEFNKLRPIAFPKAQFGKDNQVSISGSKGDYIYREFDDDDNEVLTIMFEMKNEDDLTSTKHKNKDFFRELDKDRREKNCEYAVLVSLLEKDNEYYDDIVTVPEYSNMFVIRPQHFITIIGFLRQGNLKSQELRRTIHTLKNQNIDVTNFEANMNSFKEAFSRNYSLASDQFTKAIEEIDKTIDHLNKVKENLLKSDNNLRLANNKASELTIKRLTTNSPSVAKAFEEQTK